MRQGRKIATPGGVVDLIDRVQGQDPADAGRTAAARELREEAGLHLRDDQLNLVPYLAGGHAHYSFAVILDQRPGMKRPRPEIQK